MKYLILMFFMYSCSPETEMYSEEKVYIYIDGKKIELVSDEYDNYYLKQKTECGIIYIPYTFPVEEEEVPRVYEVKIQ